MSKLTIGLVGNPNCGKTTLFNALTGSHQRVGNWSGVTVERKTGHYHYLDQRVDVVDLPGVYSLVSLDQGAMDEQIACDYILSNQAQLIVNIVDASHLERHLYLTTQLLEMQLPMIVVLNMMDMAEQQKIQIDIKALQRRLGCPVIPVQANKAKGLHALQIAIAQVAQQPCPRREVIQYPSALQTAVKKLSPSLKVDLHSRQAQSQAQFVALQCLEGDHNALSKLPPQAREQCVAVQAECAAMLNEDIDITLADLRYGFVHKVVQDCVIRRLLEQNKVTRWIDKIILNRVLGIPIFLAVMYTMFLFAINIGGAFQDFFDQTSNTIFVDGFAQLLTHWHTPSWLVAVLAHGVGKGINTTLTFIPIIGGMFLFLSALESSGYMARAAFVMDRCMRALGLPGKSFVPMIVGFGCNVPAVMATRTLDNRRDRILTVMMSPFMSCGARLAIFAVFTAAFFPVGGQNVVFALYLIGIGMAILTGWILRKTLLQGDPAPFILELPPYHLPTLRAISLQTWMRLKRFIFKAGKLIIPICMLIGVCNAISVHGGLTIGEADQHSILSILGRWLTPLFHPMGIHDENWPATVGLLTGTLAKEVVIATLNTLYSQVGHLTLLHTDFNFWVSLKAALLTIPHNLAALQQSLGNPLMGYAPEHAVSKGVYGIMYQRFLGQAAAFAYLIFVLLYTPCVSTMAVIAREISTRWAMLSVLWSLAIAYAAAVFFYQAATFSLHPVVSSESFAIIIVLFAVGLFSLRLLGRNSAKVRA